MKRTICLILVAIMCIGVLAGCSGKDGDGGSGGSKNGGTTLKSFDVMFNRADIETFLNKVCKNIDADSAKVESVIATSYSVSDIYKATLEIHLNGHMDKVELRFYNSSYSESGSEKVEMIELPRFGDRSEGGYVCSRVVILGLEKTLGGINSAQYLKPADQLSGEYQMSGESINVAWIDSSYYSEITGEYCFSQHWEGDYWICSTAKATLLIGWDDDGLNFEYRLERGNRG